MEFQVNIINELSGTILYSYKTKITPQINWAIFHDGYEYKVIKIYIHTNEPNVLAVKVKLIKHG